MKNDFPDLDADKENYLNYLKLVIPRLSDDGIAVVDNVLWSGEMLENNSELDSSDTSTRTIKSLNDYVAASTELYGTMLRKGDGIFLITKNRV